MAQRIVPSRSTCIHVLSTATTACLTITEVISEDEETKSKPTPSTHMQTSRVSTDSRAALRASQIDPLLTLTADTTLLTLQDTAFFHMGNLINQRR